MEQPGQRINSSPAVDHIVNRLIGEEAEIPLDQKQENKLSLMIRQAGRLFFAPRDVACSYRHRILAPYAWPPTKRPSVDGLQAPFPLKILRDIAEAGGT